MISLPSKPFQNVAARSQFFVPTALLANNRAATSLWVDNVTQASTLYPQNFNNSNALGSIQTYLDGQYAPSTGVITSRASVVFSASMIQNESRYLVAEPFFNKYKQWVSVGINTDLTTAIQQTVTDAPNSGFIDSYYISGNKFILYWAIGSTNDGALQCGEVQSNGSITWGARVVQTTDNRPASGSYGRICSLGTDKFAMIYREYLTGYPKVVIGTISGVTITLGTSVVVDNTVVNNAADICKIDTDKILVTYTQTGLNWYAVATIVGLVPTFGTPVNGVTTYTNNNNVWLVENGTDKAFNLFRDTNGCRAIMITVSALVPTVNTAIEVANITNQEGYPTHQSQSGWYGGVVKVATDKFLVLTYESTAGRNNTFVVTASGATLTKASYQEISRPYNSNGQSKLVEIVAGSQYAYYSGSPANSYTPVCQVLNIDGSNNVTLAFTKANSFAIAGGDLNDYYWYEKVGSYMVGFRHNQGQVYFEYIAGTLAATIEVYNGTTQINSTYSVPVGLIYNPLDLLYSTGAIGGNRAYLRVKKTSAGTEKINIGDIVATVE